MCARQVLRLQSVYIACRYVFTDHFASVEWPVPLIRKTVTDYSAALLQDMLTEYQLLPRQHPSAATADAPLIYG